MLHSDFFPLNDMYNAILKRLLAKLINLPKPFLFATFGILCYLSGSLTLFPLPHPCICAIDFRDIHNFFIRID